MKASERLREYLQDMVDDHVRDTIIALVEAVEKALSKGDKCQPADCDNCNGRKVCPYEPMVKAISALRRALGGGG